MHRRQWLVPCRVTGELSWLRRRGELQRGTFRGWDYGTKVHLEVAMNKWTRRIRAAVGMGLTWAAGWGVIGLLIGLASYVVPMDWFLSVFDAPLPALALPGFFGGAAFSTVLGIAGRRRRFDQLSLPIVTAWGAIGGLLLTIIPVLAVGPGVVTAALATVLGTLTLLSAASAAGTLMLARRAEDRVSISAPVDLSGVGLTASESRDLLGDGADEHHSS